jgi:hypothetical protein
MKVQQGLMSHITVKNGKIHKFIHDHNAYGDPVGPFEECKILKYISKLGPEFPQNVNCDGAYRLSYDYIPGVRLKDFLKENQPLTLSQQKNIALKVIKIYYKLFLVGFYHGDPNLTNFILDDLGIIHILDFGLAYSPYRTIISKPIIYSYRDSESDSEESEREFLEPPEEYEDLDFIPDYSNFIETLDDLLDELFDDELIIDEDLYESLKENVDNINKIIFILE